MADQTVRTGTSETRHGETLRSFSEQRLEASRKFTENPALQATCNPGRQTSPMKGWQSTDATRKPAQPDYVSSLAETISRAGREFENDLPIAGKYMRHASCETPWLRCS